MDDSVVLVEQLSSLVVRASSDRLSDDFEVLKQFNQSIASSTPYQFDFIIENERGIKLFGIPLYSHKSLLPLIDPSNYQTINGKKLSITYSNLENYPLPDFDWQWVWDHKILFWQHNSKKNLDTAKETQTKMIIPLALAIIRIKRKTHGDITDIVNRMCDDINPQIVGYLADFNIDYYSYNMTTKNNYYDLSKICQIVKYFLTTGCSKYHDHIVFTFLSKIRTKKFDVTLQSFTLDCLRIIGNSSSPTKLKLLWFYYFLLKFKPSEVGPFCLSNMYNAINHRKIVNTTITKLLKEYNFKEYPFSIKHTNALVLFHVKLLQKLKFNPVLVKALVITHGNPAILRISMNSC
ncbi:hypothetical protein G210_3768 [Candida maltosa Xu316]|uniref:Uncharacterized protein n=1 Tax=Candida maltosa (strain Xu316) TaxID=1245528 RepID=M3JT34_CANMX|nr:hypothetical protein G210_3768 [Candida maltosa Xu316]